MSFFSFFKNKPTLSFVFDIRDTTVSVVAVRFEKDKKAEIILGQTAEIKYRKLEHHKKYLGSMMAALDRANVALRKDLIKNGHTQKISKNYFFVGSPWVVSQAKTIKINKDKPFEINNQFLSTIIVGEESTLEKNIEIETQEPNWKILEEKIIQAKLNGYKTDEIYGKKTLNLAIELFVSFIPYQIKDKLSLYTEKVLGNRSNIQNHSSTISSYSFFRDLYTNKNDFIYIDIAKLVTEIYVVRDDIIFGVASMPFGEESILQTSLSKSNLSKEIFTSHLGIGIDGKFDLAAHNNGEDLLKYGFDLWEMNLRRTLAKICTEMNIPNIAFIIPNNITSQVLIKKYTDKAKNQKLVLLGSNIEISPIIEGITNSFILGGKNFLNHPHIKIHVVYIDRLIKN